MNGRKIDDAFALANGQVVNRLVPVGVEKKGAPINPLRPVVVPPIPQAPTPQPATRPVTKTRN